VDRWGWMYFEPRAGSILGAVDTTSNVGTSPRPRPRSSRERARRDAAIFQSAARGRLQADIAAEHGITTRQVQRIVAAFRADGEQEWVDPIAEVSATLELLRQAVADMARIEEGADNHAAHIGATRLKIEARIRRQELMQALGILPRELHALTAAQEMVEIFKEFSGVLNRYGVPDEALRELERLADRAGHLGRARPPQEAIAA
jgi:hypothetical protein